MGHVVANKNIVYDSVPPEVMEQALVEQHASMIKRIAYHLLGRLPDNIQMDDMVQVGMVALLEASRNYDTSQGASFETYAGIRIRGAMLDEVRRDNWAPRSVFKKAREISAAIRVVENREGRPAKDWEIAEQLDLSLADYHCLLQEARGQSLVSFDEVVEVGESVGVELSDHRWNGEERLQKDELQHLLAQNIADLPERERLVMSLYYVEELNLREVGLVLEVSESRVCQIHTQAILRLKNCMEKADGFI